MKRHLLLTLLLLSYTTLHAQIKVEFLSRDDTFAFLGTGSDNRVRIRNLPPGAEVSITPGQAVHVKDDEYVLCRFVESSRSRRFDTSTIYADWPRATDLTIRVNNKTIFAQTYTLFFTLPSGSTFNPVIPAKPIKILFGKKTIETSSLIIVKNQLDSALANGLLSSSDSDCKINLVTVAVLPKGCDYIGPYSFTAKNDIPTVINDKLKNLLSSTRNMHHGGTYVSHVYRNDSKLFFDIKLEYPDEGIYSLPHIVVAVE
ncbi:MAG: hypothetical protein V4649_15560 [Bacteroidota bacterium]